MILGFALTLLLYFMSAALFRLVWGVNTTAALGLLIVIGAVLIYFANPWLAAYLGTQVAWTILIYALCRRLPARANALSWLVFLGLVPVNLVMWFGDSNWAHYLHDQFSTIHWQGVEWTLGSTFFVVRTFVSMREALQEKRFSWLAMLAGLTFVPAFSAGPIFGSMPFRVQNIAARLDVKVVTEALLKLGWGTAALYVIAPAIRNVMEKDGSTLLAKTVDLYLGLAALYFDFSGYTLMAIAMAAFCGVTLPENFNRPYLAKSIREFWQRWHMSLSWFVSTYLFRPYVRRTGNPRAGIFLAFVAVGLWHELSIGYLLWGLGHGAALSLAMKPPKLWTRIFTAIPRWLSVAITWFLTITWVASLSMIANSI